MAEGDMLVRCFTGGVFSQNAYLVTCTGSSSGILIDPGAAVGEMLSLVEREAISIQAIILTHAHLDHLEGVARAKRELAVPVKLTRADEPLYHAAAAQAQQFGMTIETLPPVDEFLEMNEVVNFGDCALTVRPAPGHSPGHVILVGDGAALVGDCIFAGSIGRTDLPGGDLSVLMNSIRTEILTLGEETVLYSGHGPETTVGHERATNPFLNPNLGGSTFA
ncbi:MAG TPA: MBL fold metallo-hydrolase [Longimicrobiaceae bacterium]|nr:MBL fold metallo-hydrolase [Longimicrobiaceae bacterium]